MILTTIFELLLFVLTLSLVSFGVYLLHVERAKTEALWTEVARCMEAQRVASDALRASVSDSSES